MKASKVKPERLASLAPSRALGAIALLAAVYLAGFVGWHVLGEARQRKAQTALVKVARLDATVTLDARLAAETGNAAWPTRFYADVEALNGALETALKAVPGDPAARPLRAALSAHLGLRKKAVKQARNGELAAARDTLKGARAGQAEETFIDYYSRLSQRLGGDAGLARGLSLGAAACALAVLFLGGGAFFWLFKQATEMRWRLTVGSRERQRGQQELELARAELAGQLERMNEARQLSERALAEQIGQARRQDAKNRLFSKAFENSHDVVMITDAPVGQAPRVLQVNDAFEKMTGFTREEILGRTSDLLHGPETDPNALAGLQKCVQSGETGQAELIHYRKDGAPFWVELSLLPVHDERGFQTHWVSIQRDIDERKKSEEKIYFQSRHDALTGLPNRTLFQEQLAGAVEQAKIKDLLVGVLFLDIDRFKHVNDSLGHLVGDAFLQQVAGRIQGRLRPQDTVARIGGDEFTVLLPNMPDTEQIGAAAERLLETLHAPFQIEGHEIFITASIGVSIAPQDGEEIVTLLRSADQAMYSAKDDGRDSVRFYTKKLTDRGIDRLQLETAMRKALEKGEFVLHYQPQIDLATGQIFGAEALIRWESETLGKVSPGQFIPIAEETGLITAIGEWGLTEAARQAKIWHSRGYNMKVAVNLSARQFADPSIVKLVRDVLERTMLPPDYLDIELTESTLLQVGKASGILKQLKNLGVKLSVDDFGTGYSSLAYLKSLPLDVLKIDKSFVDGLGDDKRSAAVVHALIELAKGIDAETVAEGVETEIQREKLTAMGCHAMQGFLVSPAVAPDAFERLLITYNAQARFRLAA